MRRRPGSGTPCLRRRILLARIAFSVVASWLMMSGCSERDPLDIAQSGPPPSSSSTVPLGEPLQPRAGPGPEVPSGVPVPAADGRTVTPADLAAAGTALSRNETNDVVLGGDFNRRFLSVQVRAVGFSEDAAACVVNTASTSATGFDGLTLGALTGVMGQIGQSLAPCLTTGGVPTNIGAPDFSRVPAAEVRSVLQDLYTGSFSSAGLDESQAACVGTQLVSNADDSALGTLFSTGPQQLSLSSELLACLSAADITALARK